MSIERGRKYLIANPSAIFVLGFIALLILCAFILVSSPSNMELADNVATYAFYLLVPGVILQFLQVQFESELKRVIGRLKRLLKGY